MVSIIGYGSQGSAWASCLSKHGASPTILLRPNSLSLKKASDDGFSTSTLEASREHISQLPLNQKNILVFLCPDDQIAPVYEKYFAELDQSICVVLGHGYASYAGHLKQKNKNHFFSLLAPKAIGSELEKACLESHPHSHDLAAGVYFPTPYLNELMNLAQSLGFHESKLIQTDFETETIGDLISEQVLLCGGIFPLLAQCMKAMRDADVPERLIKEECLTELELVSRVIRNHGADQTFLKISEAAQAGALLMNEELEKIGLSDLVSRKTKAIQNKTFVKEYEEGDWRSKRQSLLERLQLRQD